MASAPPAPFKVLALAPLLLLGWLGCRSVPSQSSPQATTREDTRERVLEQIQQQLHEGKQQKALQIWQRIPAEDRRQADSSSDIGYLRARLFSTRLLQNRPADWANSQVSALTVDHDDLWIGTWLGGVARYSLPLDQFQIFHPNRRSLEPLVVYHIRPTKHYVWVLANDGIKRYNKHLGTMTPFSPAGFTAKPTDILALNESRLLVSTIDDGLWEFSRGMASRIASEPAGKHLTVLASSPTLGVLVGTVDRGVFVFQDGKMRSLIADPLRPLKANVTSLVDDGKDVWIGTSGQGIVRWNHSRRTSRRYHAGNSIIPDDWVEDLLLYQQQIFAVTMQGGFVAYDDQQQSWIDWQAGSGLMSDTITTLVASDDRLYYGTLGSGVVQLNWADYVTHR